MNQSFASQNSLNPSHGTYQPSEKRVTNTSLVNSEGNLFVSSQEKQTTTQNETVKLSVKNVTSDNPQQSDNTNKQAIDVFAKDLKDLTSKEISSGIRQPSNSSLFWSMMLSKWEIERQKRRKL